MATRNQVLSLFGASPEQIMQRQAQEQAQAIQAMRNPYQQVGAVLGTGLGRLFGAEPAEVTRQRELYSQLEGVNFENPEQMRAAAASIASQFPDRALQLLSLAEQSEARQQQIATSAAQQAQAEAAVETVSVPYMEERVVIDPLTQQSRIEYRPTNIDVARDEADYYRNLFKTQTQGNGASRTETTSRAIPENAIRVNTVVGAPVALVGDEYFIITDEGTLGPRVENIQDLGGVVDPKKVEPPRPPELPVVKQRREEIEQKITEDRLKQPSTAAQDQTNPFSF